MRIVLLAAAAFICTYAVLDLNKLHSLYYFIDSGIFLQSLAHFAHDGSAFNWAEMRSHWLVHDSWFLIVLAPFVRAYPYQETLVAAQLLLIGGSSIVLYSFARTIGVGKTPATLLCLAYLISPSVQGFAYNDFSESHFEPALIFALAIAVYKRSWVWTLVFTQALLGIKEDIGLFLLWFGIVGAIWYDRRLGMAVASLAAVNAIAYQVLVAMHGSHPSMPAYSLRILHPPQDIAFLIEMLVPFAFAPLWLRWRVLVALPLLAELFLPSTDGFLARAGVHYTEALVSLIAIGSAFVMRERPVFARYALPLSAVMALLFNTTVLHFGRHPYVTQDREYARLRALVLPQAPAAFEFEDQGSWAVAAGDLNAKVNDAFTRPLRREKPVWNTK
ncbi:MAG: DUF2079 domain-containing protein [Candidatus Eremiobacteraeota bacterium]|nr:DUF2079 domain-containing protein [Candidatus Eremiobacteraeota bacterium]